MIIQLGRHYSLLLSFLLYSGIIIAITSNNWIITWIGLELNIYAFIPFILQTSNNLENEATLKYFLAQAIASSLLLIGLLLAIFSWISTILIISALLINLGAAPYHFWFPTVISSSSWSTCWIVTTVQNIAPLLLLNFSSSLSSSLFLSIVAATSAITGASNALNQTQLRPLIAYSSIHHIGWIISSLYLTNIYTILYFSSYFFISSSLIFFIFNLNLNTLTPSNTNSFNNPIILAIILSLLSLAGQPPLLGFFPNIIILISISSNNIFLLAIILISTATISLYYYINLILHVLFFNLSNRPPSLFHFKPPSFSILMISLLTAISTLLFSITIFFII